MSELGTGRRASAWGHPLVAYLDQASRCRCEETIEVVGAVRHTPTVVHRSDDEADAGATTLWTNRWISLTVDSTAHCNKHDDCACRLGL